MSIDIDVRGSWGRYHVPTRDGPPGLRGRPDSTGFAVVLSCGRCAHAKATVPGGTRSIPVSVAPCCRSGPRNAGLHWPPTASTRVAGARLACGDEPPRRPGAMLHSHHRLAARTLTGMSRTRPVEAVTSVGLASLDKDHRGCQPSGEVIRRRRVTGYRRLYSNVLVHTVSSSVGATVRVPTAPRYAPDPPTIVRVDGWPPPS